MKNHDRYTNYENGTFLPHRPDECDLLMFQEITEMSGHKWVNINSPFDSTEERYKKACAFDAGKQHIKDIHNIK